MTRARRANTARPIRRDFRSSAMLLRNACRALPGNRELRWLLEMKTRRVLIRLGQREQLRFAVRLCHEEHARRCATRGEAVWKRKAWIAGQVPHLGMPLARAG